MLGQNTIWMEEFGSAEDDYSQASAPDGFGGVYLAGHTKGPLGGVNLGLDDSWIGRFDSNGNRLWLRQFGTAESDQSHCIGANGTSGLFVAGNTDVVLVGGQTVTIAWIASYDENGTRLWYHEFGSLNFTQSRGVTSDGMGGAYLCGVTTGFLTGNSAGFDDAWLAHYDAAGNQTWIRQFGTSFGDTARDVATDGAGGVFVTGTTYGDLAGPSNGSFDAWLAHFDSTGNQVWMQQFGTPSADFSSHLAPDMQGGVFMVGTTSGVVAGSASAGDSDAWVARYDGTGQRTWIQQFGFNFYDVVNGVTTDGMGGVYCCGTKGGLIGSSSAGINAWFARLDGMGNLLTHQQFGSPGADRATGIVPDGFGGALISGTTSQGLVAPTLGGSDVWLGHFDDLVADMGCSGAANSTGFGGRLNAFGSNAVMANELTLRMYRLPPRAFGVILASRSAGVTTGFGGGQGDLCMASPGIFDNLNQVWNTGSLGAATIAVDLTMFPGMPQTAVQAGETWYFQAWYRDQAPSNTTNLTNLVAVSFF